LFRYVADWGKRGGGLWWEHSLLRKVVVHKERQYWEKMWGGDFSYPILHIRKDEGGKITLLLRLTKEIRQILDVLWVPNRGKSHRQGGKGSARVH